MSDCEFRRSIDRHFAGTISERAERRLRAHLPGCAACDAYYRRHLVLEAALPGGLGPERRLARGLGLAARRSAWPAYFALAAVCIVALAWPSPGMTERGAAPASELVAFRIRGASHARLGGSLAPDDELSFAYRNVAHKPYLLVFAVDNRGRVYWYYPAWSDPSRTPAAEPIDASSELVELPEAIRHDIAGARLWLYAAFVDRAWTTVEVEARAAAVAPGAPIALDTAVPPAYAIEVQR